MPHLPINLSDKPVSAVIARTDPNEQESVVLLPELERYADEAIARLMAAQRGFAVSVSTAYPSGDHTSPLRCWIIMYVS